MDSTSLCYFPSMQQLDVFACLIVFDGSFAVSRNACFLYFLGSGDTSMI